MKTLAAMLQELQERYRNVPNPWDGGINYGVLNPCEHEPVLTGMQKSWCKTCDVNMRFIDGKYQVEG